jgi:hypothetical protein
VERQYVGIDLHRRRSVIVRKNWAGEVLSKVRIEIGARGRFREGTRIGLAASFEIARGPRCTPPWWARRSATVQPSAGGNGPSFSGIRAACPSRMALDWIRSGQGVESKAHLQRTRLVVLTSPYVEIVCAAGRVIQRCV